MSTDPIAALIAAGAFPAEPFAPNSRYRGVPLGLFGPDPDHGIPYVLRRFTPQRRAIPAAFEHLVRGVERPDLLAAQAYGDPELYWRIADANAVTDPFALTDTMGGRIAIPQPPGV